MLAAVRHAHQFLPFPMLGLDTDNGSEFLNTILLSSCQHEQLAFTRSRWSKPIPSRKKSLGAEPRSEQFAALQVPERIGRSLIPSTLPEVLRLIGGSFGSKGNGWFTRWPGRSSADAIKPWLRYAITPGVWPSILRTPTVELRMSRKVLDKDISMP